MNALEVRGLKKCFGSLEVLKSVDFQARKGTILGFVGKNGTGKTTTMKILTGLMASDGGRVVIDGREVPAGLGYKGTPIGYLPDVPAFYNYLRPLEYLILCGEIIGEKPREIRWRGEELLELVGLKGERKRIGTFSRGMKQRLGMAQALMGRPGLLLCDEPTSALDPMGRKEILELISKLKEQTTVVFSTHVLSDVEQVCDDVAILDGGKILYCGGMIALKEHHSAALVAVTVRRGYDVDVFVEKLESCLPGALFSAQDRRFNLSLPIDPADQERFIGILWSLIGEEGVVLDEYSLKNPSLEQVFLEVTK